MRIPTLKPMPDLKPIAKRIVTVDRMAALFMPRNLRGIRSPVKLASIEFFEDRRGKIPRGGGKDVGAPFLPRSSPRGLIHPFVNNTPSRGFPRVGEIARPGAFFSF